MDRDGVTRALGVAKFPDKLPSPVAMGDCPLHWRGLGGSRVGDEG
jgi:hypothetical protein